MKLKPIAAATILLALVGSAHAHVLDEYLQATLLTVEKDHIQASMRLIPGVAVAASVLATIDTDGNGVLSAQEQHAYAERTIQNLTLTIDGHPLHPKLLSATYPEINQIRQGLGEIHLEFTANLPPGGPNRRLTLEGPSRTQKVAYLVNSLVPADPDIHIVTQTRNYLQSFYQLDYTQPATDHI